MNRVYTIVVGLSLVLGAGPQLQSVIIYTTSGFGGQLGTIDTTTGVGTTIGSFGIGSTFGNAFDLSGTLYATTGSTTLSTINLTTGAATVVGTLPENMYAIEFDSAGTMYGLAWSGNLYLLDKTTGGSLGVIGNSGISSTMDIAFDSSDTLYATVSGILYTVSTSTGAVTSSVALTGAGSVMGIMFDASDVLYATAYVSSSPLYIVNAGTGSSNAVASPGLGGPHGGDIFIASAAVPEPSSLVLMTLGSLGLISLRWRRKRHAA